MRIYFDENFSPHLINGLKIIQEGRKDDIEVYSIKDEFGQGVDDEVWIPRVASQRGVAITQDNYIHRSRAQWELCQANKIGVFFVRPSKKNWNYWTSVQLIIHCWQDICKAAKDTPRPFAYEINPNTKRVKPLK